MNTWSNWWLLFHYLGSDETSYGRVTIIITQQEINYKWVFEIMYWQVNKINSVTQDKKNDDVACLKQGK